MHLHSHLFVSALGPMSTGVSGSSAIALPVFDSQPIFLFGPLLSVSAVHGEGRRVDSPLRHRSRADKSGGTTQARVALLEGGKGSLLRFVRASSPPSDALAPAEGRIVREQVYALPKCVCVGGACLPCSASFLHARAGACLYDAFLCVLKRVS